MVNLKMLGKCGNLEKKGIGQVSWRSKGLAWAKVTSNVLKCLTNDVQKVGLAVVGVLMTSHV